MNTVTPPHSSPARCWPRSPPWSSRFKTLSEQISEQLDAHTDAHIFTSLPRSGRVRAARLLAEIGDCRARFPTPEALFCLAGAAPSTRQSGKVKVVSFRWAADKQLRDAVCDFAGDSRRANPWAAKLYHDAIARGHDHPHAVRILARAWLLHHLALLARPRGLRPRQAQGAASPARRAIERGRDLTTTAIPPSQPNNA